MTTSGDNFRKMTEADWDFKTNTMLDKYGETVQYLRSSHRNPETRAPVDIIKDLDEEDDIDAFMRHEISKYNRLKRQKQVTPSL